MKPLFSLFLRSRHRRILQLAGLLPLSCAQTMLGQATLDFCNFSRADAINAPVYDTDGATKLGGGFRGQLYVGETAGTLSPVGSPSPFRNLPNSSTGSGYIIAGKVVAPLALANRMVFAEFRAWDASAGMTYEAARLARGKTGRSATIRIRTGDQGLNLPGALTGLQSFSLGVEVNLPPISSGFGATTPQDRPLTITFASLLAPVSDPEGGSIDMVSVSATSTNGAPVVSGASEVVYTPKAGFMGADRFYYVVSDPFGATSTVAAQIAVLASGMVVNTAQAIVVTQASVSFGFTGLPGRSYQVERAESPVGPWEIVGTLTIQADGSGNYVDPSPPTGSGFYRMVLFGASR